MTGPTALLLAIALAAEGQIDAGLRIEALGRRLDPATPADAHAVDLTAAPRVAAELRGGGLSAQLRYSPTFTAADVGPDHRTVVMNAGDARVAFAPVPALRLEAFGHGEAGLEDRTVLRPEPLAPAGGAGGVGGPVATTQRVNVERYRAGGSLRLAPARRGELLFGGAWLLEGGTDATSRATNPLIRGAEASAEARWNASRLDVLGLRAAGVVARAARLRTDSTWVSALGTWRRRLSPSVELWTGAGAVELWSRKPAAGRTARTTEQRLAPAAELGVARTATDLNPTALLSGTLGGTVDRITGVASPSAEVTAAVSWPLARWAAVAASGSGSLLWPDSGTSRLVSVRAGPSFRLATWSRLELAAFRTRQWSTDPLVPTVDSYGASLAVTLEPDPLRF